MKYAADFLTALKAVLAIVVLFTIGPHAWAILAGLIIAIGLCDAFDGIAARTWPYTAAESARLPWRRDPHVWDQIPNGIACATILIALSIMAPALGVPLAVVTILGTVGFQWAIGHYGNIDPKLAEHIDVTYGWTWSGVLLTAASMATVMATPHWSGPLAAYTAGAIILISIKWDRATSRKEVVYGNGK